MPNLLTTAEARALIKTRLSDGDLDDVIAREEATLARVIGPLSGARTITFYPPDYGVGGAWGVRLPRPADILDTVDDGGTTLSDSLYRLGQGGWALERISGTTILGFTGPLAITYTPTDELEVKRVLIELSRLTLTETGYAGETLGAYTYQQNSDARRMTRKALTSSLLGPQGGRPAVTSVPMIAAYRGSWPDPRINAPG